MQNKKKLTCAFWHYHRRGAFGAVSAVQKKDTRCVYAMKEMDKRQVKFHNHEWICRGECLYLSQMNSPFVLNLVYSFQDEDMLYLVFNLCQGVPSLLHMPRLHCCLNILKCYSVQTKREPFEPT